MTLPIMNATIPIHLAPPENPTHPAWGDAPTSRVPGWVYTDAQIYQREMAQLFYQGHWCYVGLECEIPKAGDYKRTQIGERSVAW